MSRRDLIPCRCPVYVSEFKYNTQRALVAPRRGG